MIESKLNYHKHNSGPLKKERFLNARNNINYWARDPSTCICTTHFFHKAMKRYLISIKYE